jgi:hypothetical protein
VYGSGQSTTSARPAPRGSVPSRARTTVSEVWPWLVLLIYAAVAGKSAADRASLQKNRDVLATGALRMTGGNEEMSGRTYPSETGGTTRQRRPARSAPRSHGGRGLHGLQSRALV